jgi:hypothetical protein
MEQRALIIKVLEELKSKDRDYVKTELGKWKRQIALLLSSGIKEGDRRIILLKNMIRAIQKVLLDKKEEDVLYTTSKEEEDFMNDEGNEDFDEKEDEYVDETTELTEDDLEVQRLFFMDEDDFSDEDEQTKCMKLLISIINYHQSGLLKSRNYKIQQIKKLHPACAVIYNLLKRIYEANEEREEAIQEAAKYLSSRFTLYEMEDSEVGKSTPSPSMKMSRRLKSAIQSLKQDPQNPMLLEELFKVLQK